MGAGCCGCGKEAIIPPAPQQKPLLSATRLSREYSPAQHFSNVSISTSDPMKLIQGYRDEPLVSLEEALKPFDGKIDRLSYFIETAKKECYFPSPHGLTHDESAAIYIYTMQWKPKSLYDHLEEAWKSNDRSKTKPWFKYLHLFKSALDKLPNISGEIWQVLPAKNNLENQLSSNSSTFYSCMGTSAPSEKELKQYIEKHSDANGNLIAYKSVNGKDISDYAVDKSKIAMMWPGTKLGVTGQEKTSNGRTIYHLGPILKSTPKNPKSNESTISSSEVHFVCRYTGCGNRCPRDHEGSHCHTFARLLHVCEHHCVPFNKCQRCHRAVPNLCKCYKCGTIYCEKCCFK